MTIKMYRWDIKKWEDVKIPGTTQTNPWAGPTVMPLGRVAEAFRTPYSGDSVSMPTAPWDYSMHPIVTPGESGANPHHPQDPAFLSRFRDQAAYSQLHNQQQRWFQNLVSERQDLPPGFAEAQGLDPDTKPQDLLRVRDQYGRLPPALGGAGGSKQNPYTLYTDQGKRDIKGPLSSRFMDNVNWLAGLGQHIPSTAGHRERKFYAQQGALIAAAARNMFVRGRTNPNYWGHEPDQRLVRQALKTGLLPRMGYTDQQIRWLERTVGGGPQKLETALETERKRGARGYREEEKAKIAAGARGVGMFSRLPNHGPQSMSKTKLQDIIAQRTGKHPNVVMSDYAKKHGLDKEMYWKTPGKARKEHWEQLADHVWDSDLESRWAEHRAGGKADLDGDDVPDDEDTYVPSLLGREVHPEDARLEGAAYDPETKTYSSSSSETIYGTDDTYIDDMVEAFDNDPQAQAVLAEAIEAEAGEDGRPSPDEWVNIFEKIKPLLARKGVPVDGVRWKTLINELQEIQDAPQDIYSAEALSGSVEDYLLSHPSFTEGGPLTGRGTGNIRDEILSLVSMAADEKDKGNKEARKYIDNVIRGMTSGRVGIDDFAGLRAEKKMGDVSGRRKRQKRKDSDEPGATEDMTFSSDSPLDLAWSILKIG